MTGHPLPQDSASLVGKRTTRELLEELLLRGEQGDHRDHRILAGDARSLLGLVDTEVLNERRMP